MIKVALIMTPLENDKRRILKEAEDFRKEISVYLGNELIFSDAAEIQEEEYKFIFVASGGSARAFKKIFQMMSGPFILITTQSNNSLAAAMEELSYINDHGEQGEILHGCASAVAERISCIWRSFEAIRKLRSSKIGVLGSPNMLINSEYEPALLEKTSGAKTTYITMQEVMDEIDRKSYVGNEYTENLISTGYNRQELEKSFFIYGALKRIIAKNGFSAIALRCFDLLEPYETSGCLALAMLNSEGIPASCEGDTRSLLSMIVMGLLTSEPCFMANPSRIDMKKREIVLAHCTVPLSMVDEYTLMTHFESGLSVAVKGKFSNGIYTLFKCREDMKTYFVQKAEFAGNLSESNLCRTQLKLKVEDVESYLTKPLSNHQIVVSGDHTQVVNEFFKWIQLKNKDYQKKESI